MGDNRSGMVCGCLWVWLCHTICQQPEGGITHSTWGNPKKLLRRKDCWAEPHPKWGNIISECPTVEASWVEHQHTPCPLPLILRHHHHRGNILRAAVAFKPIGQLAMSRCAMLSLTNWERDSWTMDPHLLFFWWPAPCFLLLAQGILGHQLVTCLTQAKDCFKAVPAYSRL
jgi:hypothetical protein